jgi:hypothetical protein
MFMGVSYSLLVGVERLKAQCRGRVGAGRSRCESLLQSHRGPHQLCIAGSGRAVREQY